MVTYEIGHRLQFKRLFIMKKLILTVSFFVLGSYFSNPIQSAQASGRHTTKHHSSTHHHSKASWYGAKFHGKKTANGETFDMYAMTAAHNTLPLSSYAEVTNLKNHRSVIVRINDRGSFHGKRAMDLSYAAAKKLGIKGIGSVQITPLEPNQTLALLSQ
jgi:rare lipoprotein A